jgi:hypothetical protein
MNRISRASLRGLAVAGLVLLVAAAAHADPRTRQRQPARRNATFNFSGVFSGVLDGKILIGDRAFPLSESARFYLLGTGPVEIQRLPIGARVFASGTSMGETGVVRRVVVRPAGESREPTGPASSYVRVREHPTER